MKSFRFLRSATGREGYADLALPQIALAGRSNVGKSSFVNALAGCRLARVSSEPGKTRSINFYAVNEELLLVDLPGYGYAKVSKNEQRRWGPMLEDYLTSNPFMRHLFLVMDIRREPNDSDRQMAYWSQHYAVPCTIIATKADRLPRSRRSAEAGKLSDALGMTLRTPTIVFSAKDGTGRQETLNRIGEILSGT